MKKIILAIALSLTCFANYAQWNDITPNDIRSYIYNVQFLDSTNGYIAYEYNMGKVLKKTSNGGKDWSLVNDGSKNGIVKDFIYLNKDSMYAITYHYSGTTYYENLSFSLDGGYTFDTLITNDYKISYLDVNPYTHDIFYSKSVGYNDSGKNYIVYRLYKIVNDSSKIVYEADSKTEEKILGSDLHFVSENVGYYFGLGHDYYDGYYIYIGKTTDGGNSWKVINTIKYKYHHYWKILFTSENTAYMKISQYDAKNLSNYLDSFYKSTDGGFTWTPMMKGLPDFEGNVYLHDFYFVTNDIGFLLTNYELYKTIDGGANWKLIWDDGAIYNRHIREIYGIDQNTIFLISYYPNDPCIYKTTNGGISFIEEKLPKQTVFTLKPNPANRHLFITFNKPIKEPTAVRVYDLKGQMVLQTQINAKVSKLDIHNLDKGVYIIKVKTTNGEYVERFVKE